jgi:hypothetical protein
MAKEYPLKVVITAVDKFTAPFRSIAGRLTNLSNQLGIGKVTSAFGAVTTKATELFRTIMTGATLAAGAIGYLVKSTANYGDQVDEASIKAGMSATAFQRLAYAAKFAGIEQDQLASASAKLSKNIVMARGGNKELAKAFAFAGISARELRTLKPEQAFEKIATAVSKLNQNDPRRAALAMTLLGKSGAELLPMLVNGGDELRRMGDEAQRLGIIMSDADVKAAAGFNDRFDTMMMIMGGLARSIGSQLMPVVERLMVQFSGWIQKNRDLITTKTGEWITNFANALPELISGIGSLVALGASVVDMFGGIQNAAIAMAAVMAGPLILAVTQLGIAMMATPIGWITAGIAGLVLLAYKLYQNWDKVTAKFNEFKNSMGGLWDKTMNVVGQGFMMQAGVSPTSPASPIAGGAPISVAGGQQSKVAVTVDLNGLPAGTKVSQQQTGKADFELNQGFAMAPGF